MHRINRRSSWPAYAEIVQQLPQESLWNAFTKCLSFNATVTDEERQQTNIWDLECHHVATFIVMRQIAIIGLIRMTS